MFTDTNAKSQQEQGADVLQAGATSLPSPAPHEGPKRGKVGKGRFMSPVTRAARGLMLMENEMFKSLAEK